MRLRDAIQNILEEIITTVIDEAVSTERSEGYKLIMLHDSRMMILSKGGMTVAIMKSIYIGASKHSLGKVQQVCSELAGVYDRFNTHVPSVGVLIAGSLSPAARHYLHAAGIRQALIDYTAVQTVFADAGIDVQNIFDSCDLNEDQLDRITERLLDANRLKLSVFIKSILSGVDHQSATSMLQPDDVHAMAAATNTIVNCCLDDILAEIDDREVKSVIAAKLKDGFEAAYCSGYRAGRASTLQKSSHAGKHLNASKACKP